MSTPSPITTSTAVASEFLRALTELTGMTDISAPQVQLLLQLRIQGPTSQAKLDELTGVKKSANSRNVAKLGAGEKPMVAPGPGWVTSEPDLNDRRNNRVRLTQKGEALVEEAAQRAARFLPR